MSIKKGSTHIAGLGLPGFNATIRENADNTDTVYKLDITNKDGTFSTPNLYAGGGASVPLDSPEFTGIPTAPTPSVETNTNQIATTEFVQDVADTKAPLAHEHAVSDITDLTSSVEELNYTTGVTSNIQEQLDEKSASDHTHNYAGSDAVGGSATSAVKLETARNINGVAFDGSADVSGAFDAPAIGKDNYIAYPDGGVFIGSGIERVGCLKVALPQSWSNNLIKFKISIYNYSSNTSCDYYVAGYSYNATKGWVYNPTAYSIGSPNGTRINNLTVRFGHDGSKCAIYIGETNTTWSNLIVAVSDIIIGSGNTFDNWKSGWSISTTDTLGTITATVENPFIGSGYLPLSGGTLNQDSTIKLRPVLTGTNAIGLGFCNNAGNTMVGGLYGFFINDALSRISLATNTASPWLTTEGLSIYLNDIKWKNNDVLHTGNSKKVITSTTDLTAGSSALANDTVYYVYE